MSGDSLTPPLSPEVGFELEDIPVPSPPKAPRLDEESRGACFSCLGEVQAKGFVYHNEGYWRSGFLQRLFNSPSCHTGSLLDPYKTFTCFSLTWPSTVLQNSNLDKLFLILRQQIGEFQTLAQRARFSFVIEDAIDGQDLKEQTCNFLQYITDSLICYPLSEDCLDRLVPNLHSLLLCMGRLCELPHSVLHTQSAGSKGSVSHQCLHLHLDVYWRVLSILHTLQIKFPGYRYARKLCVTPDNDVDTPLYEQMLHLILWDLVSLSNIKYMNNIANHDPQRTGMFSCSCMKELWSLVLKLTEWRSNNHIGESFWISLHHVIKSVLEMESQEVVMEVEDCTVIVNPPEGFKTDDGVGLCLWMMYNVAPLYTQNVPGTTKNDARAVSNYHDLLVLVKKMMTNRDLTEIVLRRHLKTVLLLTSDWEPNTGILISLWDFFYKRLNQNESIQSSSGTLEGLACIDQSVVSMYDRCKQWTQGHIGSLDKEISFQLFLRLMSLHVGKLYSSGAIQEWKQVKGRIYSKFHVRRIQELTEGGLHNLSTLFITLGMTADLEDVASKLCDFYDMLDIHSVTFAKRSVIWRGAFTLMLVYVDRNMDVTYLADRMVAAFENAVSDFSSTGIDSKHCLWKLILIYLEGLQEVVEASSSLQLSEYKLICPAVQKLLTVCSEHELRTTLSTLHSVVQKFRQLKLDRGKELISSVRESLQHAEFGGALWKNVYRFIVDHAQTLTPPPIIADIGASFCLLALTCPPDDHTLTFLTVFQTFASSDKVNVSVSCRFLSHLLACTEVMDRLKSELDNYEQFIIGVWFRCCLIVPAGSQILVEITRPVLQLSSVQNILRQAEISIEDIDEAPTLFLKALEKCHRKIQTWQEKMAFQKQVIPYFSDIQKHIAPVLRNMAPPEVVNNVFKMGGCLVTYCAKLIYVRQDVIVPGLMSSLILPHTVHNPDKPLNPVFQSAVKEHLHLFIKGLSKLAYEKDPYIQRILRDVVKVYLPKFSLRPSPLSLTTASVITVHPIVASLSGSFIHHPTPEAVKFRHTLIQTVTNNYCAVKMNMTVNEHHTMGFSFIHEVVQRTINPEVKARDLVVLLTVCLEYLLLLPDSSSTWKSILGTLQELTEAYTVCGQSVPLSDLTVLCEQFISRYFKFSSTGVIKLMEKLALLFQDLVVSVVDTLSSGVREIESKRGVGMDQKLRGMYYQVLKQLGDRGTKEIQKLQSETT